jgi:hypothetical protein
LVRIIIYLLPFLFIGEGLLYAQTADSLSDDIVQSYDYRPEPESRYLWLGIGYASGIGNSVDVYGVQELLVTCGGFTEKSYWMQYFGSYMHMPIQRTTKPSFPIKDGLSLVLAGVELRSYAPEDYLAISNYYSIGAGLGYAYWNYSAPMGLAVPANSYEFTFCGDFHFGLGFILGRSEVINSDIYFTPGVVLFLLNTVHDYPNTIFAPIVYLKARVSFSVAISRW